MATQGEIAFVQDGEPYGLNNPRKGYGFICVEGMSLCKPVVEGEEKLEPITITATHYIDPCSGQMSPITDTESVHAPDDPANVKDNHQQNEEENHHAITPTTSSK